METEIINNYQNYECSIDNIKDTLQKYGVAVVPDILNDEEIENMRKGMWDTVEYLTSKLETPLDRDNTKTWDAWFQLLPMHDMLLQTFSIGHSQFVWDIRQNPKIAKVFSKIWDCPIMDLNSSFDALSFHLPPEITGKGWYQNNDWLHVDSSFLRSNFECVQSFVTGYDINDGDASLTILEGSNNYHKKCGEEFEITNLNDWNILTQDQIDFYLSKGCKRKTVKAKAGSIILWDSRTVHCGTEPIIKRKDPNFRLVTYMCMTPKSFADESLLQQKIDAFENMFMTSHCPHRPRKFPKRKRGLTIDVPELPKPELTDLGRSLVGYNLN